MATLVSTLRLPPSTLLVACLLVAQSTYAADAWPVFRGTAQANGVATSTLAEKPELLWKKPIKGESFKTTAAIVDGVIYLGGIRGGFRAFKLADGEQLWEFSTPLGFTAPPAVRDGLVFVGDGDGKFFCLDAATGKEKWTHATEAEINAGANFYKDNVLVGSQDGSLYCFQAKTGDVVWKYSIENMIQCSPTIIENRVFLAGCDGFLHIIDVDTGKLSSKVDIANPTGNTPAAQGDHVYFGTQGNDFFCIDWRKSEKVWEYRPERAGEFASSAAIAGDIVIIGSNDLQVHGLDAKTGQQKWAYPTRGKVESSPAVVGQRAYLGLKGGRLAALDVKTGEAVWEYEAGGNFSSSPAVGEKCLVIPSDQGVVYCFGSKGP